MPDSMMKDSIKMDSTKSAAKDTAAAVVPDTRRRTEGPVDNPAAER